jgi:hypothetical protein
VERPEWRRGRVRVGQPTVIISLLGSESIESKLCSWVFLRYRSYEAFSAFRGSVYVFTPLGYIEVTSRSNPEAN